MGPGQPVSAGSPDSLSIRRHDHFSAGRLAATGARWAALPILDLESFPVRKGTGVPDDVLDHRLAALQQELTVPLAVDAEAMTGGAAFLAGRVAARAGHQEYAARVAASRLAEGEW